MDTKFLSHSTAGYLLKVPNIEAILGTNYKVNKDQVVCTVTTRGQRYKRKGHIVHLCTTPLPKGAVIIKDNQKVASPELVFLQFAAEFDMHKLILLGIQLCSHPSCSPEKALTTKSKLINFLNKTPWHRGHRKALRAVKYIEDGSASFAESLAYMALALPHALGGQNLKGAALNQKIKLNKEARKQLNKHCCYVDFFYKSEKVAVEYDSFAYHSSPAEQGRDAQRSEVLKRQGLKVLHMHTIQLYDSVPFNTFVLNLAAELKRRIQNRAKKFHEMNAKLRLLFSTCKASASTSS